MVFPAPVLCHEERFWESHGAIPGETTQQQKNTSEFYFSILLYFTFSRKFLHSSTNLTKSLKFRTNNPVTYYKHEFFCGFFLNLAVSLGSAAFLPAE